MVVLHVAGFGRCSGQRFQRRANMFFKKKKNNWRGEESTSLGVFVGTLCLALVSWVALMALSFWIAPHMLRLPGEDGGQMAALCIIFLK